MLARWPIRNKVLVGLALLAVIVAVLSISGAVGVYKYRDLVRSLELRAGELPLATQLGIDVADLRVILSESQLYRFSDPDSNLAETDQHDPQLVRHRFRLQLAAVEESFDRYRDSLDRNDRSNYRIDDSRHERERVDAIAAILDRIHEADRDVDWVFNRVKTDTLSDELEQFHRHAVALPATLHHKLWELRNEVRAEYRTLIGLVWGATGAAVLMFGLFVHLFYRWVFRPLRVLIKGSRRVADGDFDHRIHLATYDEMAGLAEAMNGMTDRFQSIKADLDRELAARDQEVQIRTKQVVRSERMASVGFLAAGVAHEINNPLASIAMCAESLEQRIGGLLDETDPQQKIVAQYLRMIQDNAFRCKGITERLLDFSRMGDVQRHNVELREIVQNVLEMVQTLGKYRDKQAILLPGEPVIAQVNAQQIKQVVLNIVANGLDSVAAGGKVEITIRKTADRAQILFQDNGCGMTPDILEHLFEPFFTRSRSGQGTGLGLSIVYSIIADHDGEIVATSDGPGRGSQFKITLPLKASAQSATSQKVPRDHETELNARRQAA